MSYGTLILGESGSGKTASLRNLDPAKTLLIQPVRKPLPFRAKGWKEYRDRNGGNIMVTDQAAEIVRIMQMTKRDIIIIDDWQYILGFQYMHSATTKFKQGEVFEFYKKIGFDGFSIAEQATLLAPNKRVYILAHTATDDFGRVGIKTLGKMLDDKIVIEGMFTTVLRTKVEGGRYLFSTQTNGNDTVKSPMGLFEDATIPNDLAAVDKAICDYYDIETAPAETPASATVSKHQPLPPTEIPEDITETIEPENINA